MLRAIWAAGAALALGACATGGAQVPAGPASYEPGPGQSAPPRARLYADCIGQAISANRYDRERNLIRFHCEGQPAALLNAEFLTWAATGGGAAHVRNGIRFTLSSPIQRDLYGVDYCTSAVPSMDEPRCTIVMNGGDFLAAP